MCLISFSHCLSISAVFLLIRLGSSSSSIWSLNLNQSALLKLNLGGFEIAMGLEEKVKWIGRWFETVDLSPSLMWVARCRNWLLQKMRSGLPLCVPWKYVLKFWPRNCRFFSIVYLLNIFPSLSVVEWPYVWWWMLESATIRVGLL